MVISRGAVALSLLVACGRTPLLEAEGAPLPVMPGAMQAPSPARGCPPMTEPARKLGVARFEQVSSLAVDGDDLYVTSHERFFPMKYRLPGAVERLPTCGGEATLIAHDQDRPEGLAVGRGWVHWRAKEHDRAGGGRNFANVVRSHQRLGGASIERRFDGGANQLAGPVLVASRLYWLEHASSGGMNSTVSLARGPEDLASSLELDRRTVACCTTWSLVVTDTAQLALLTVHAMGLDAATWEIGADRWFPRWSASQRPVAIAGFARNVYFSTLGGAVMRVPLTDLASPVLELDTMRGPSPVLAVDERALFFIGGARLRESRFDAGVTTLMDLGDAVPTAIALDGQAVYLALHRERALTEIWALRRTD